MKICFTSQGQNLEAEVDGHFGRCPYFVVYDTETKELECHVNEGPKSEHGAGIAAAQQIQQLNIDALVTGRLGPNAKKIIEEIDMKVYKKEAETVKENIDMFINEQLSPLS
ncbi:NifB/NifX family molybdenum-iron cluster-binding protein [Clostridiaceae bacterium M8S5]|nr:NifB/NifX family molybdenum-iron cluster-binding protein [Clostridiaceae bacterium M8S5]